MTKINLQQLTADREASEIPAKIQARSIPLHEGSFDPEIVIHNLDMDIRNAWSRRIARLPDLEAAYISLMTHQYRIGPLTMDRVFRAGQLENMSDMQSVLDAVEIALSAE